MQDPGGSTKLREEEDSLEKKFHFVLDNEFHDPKKRSRQVLIIVQFLQPFSIDLSYECFEAGLLWTFRWRPTKEELAAFLEHGQEPEWKPHEKFYKYINGIEIFWEPEAILKKKVTFVEDPDRELGAFFGYTCKLRGKFWETMELSNFPLDTQPLSMSFSIRKTVMELIPMKDGEWLKTKFIGKKIGGMAVNSAFVDRILGHASANRKARGLSSTEVIWHFTYGCDRETTYWLKRWGPYFIFLLLCALAAFSIDIVEDFADRMNYLVALSFVVASYQFALNEKLPDLTYLTLMDKFSLFCFSFIGITIIGNALIKWSFDDDADKMKDVDFGFLIFCTVYIVVGLLIMTIQGWRLKANELSHSHESVISESIYTHDSQKKHLGGIDLNFGGAPATSIAEGTTAFNWHSNRGFEKLRDIPTQTESR